MALASRSRWTVSKALDIREPVVSLQSKKYNISVRNADSREKQLGELAGFKDAEKTVWDWEMGGHVPSEANWNLIKRILDITEEEEKAFEREKIGERQKLDTFIREGGYVAGEADATHYDKKVIDITVPQPTSPRNGTDGEPRSNQHMSRLLWRESRLTGPWRRNRGCGGGRARLISMRVG